MVRATHQRPARWLKTSGTARSDPSILSVKWLQVGEQGAPPLEQANTFARCGTDFAAGAGLSQSQVQIRGRRSTFARHGTDFAPGAALSQVTVQISWQDFVAAVALSPGAAQIRGRRRTLARSGTNLVAGAALSQGQVQIPQQAQHLRKVSTDSRQCSTFARYRFRARRRQQISWQAKNFRKVRCRFRGRCSTFASRQAQHFRNVRYRFAAGTVFSQGPVQIRGRRSTFARSGAQQAQHFCKQ